MHPAAAFALLPAVAAVAAAPATAQPASSSVLRLERAMLRATPSNAPVATGDSSIVNSGTAEDVLLSVGIVPEVAETVDLHEMAMSEGAMSTNRAEDGVPIPAGQTVSLSSGDRHRMISGLRVPPVAGDRHAVTQRFARAGEVACDKPVLTLAGIRAMEREGAAGHGSVGQGHGAPAAGGS